MKDGFKSLIVWQKAMDLVKEVYVLTSSLPTSERYAISDQLKRAAVSVPSNIAEGSRHMTTKGYVQFLGIAHGSLAEVETQLLLVKDVYPKVTVQKALSLVDEISRMLHSIITKLKS